MIWRAPGALRAGIGANNGEGFFAISDWQDFNSVSLDPAGTNGNLLGKILFALRLDIARVYLDLWENDLAPRMGRHWKEVQKVTPVDDSSKST